MGGGMNRSKAEPERSGDSQRQIAKGNSRATVAECNEEEECLAQSRQGAKEAVRVLQRSCRFSRAGEFGW